MNIYKSIIAFVVFLCTLFVCTRSYPNYDNKVLENSPKIPKYIFNEVLTEDINDISIPQPDNVYSNNNILGKYEDYIENSEGSELQSSSKIRRKRNGHANNKDIYLADLFLQSLRHKWHKNPEWIKAKKTEIMNKYNSNALNNLLAGYSPNYYDDLFQSIYKDFTKTVNDEYLSLDNQNNNNRIRHLQKLLDIYNYINDELSRIDDLYDNIVIYTTYPTFTDRHKTIINQVLSNKTEDVLDITSSDIDMIKNMETKHKELRNKIIEFADDELKIYYNIFKSYSNKFIKKVPCTDIINNEIENIPDLNKNLGISNFWSFTCKIKIFYDKIVMVDPKNYSDKLAGTLSIDGEGKVHYNLHTQYNMICSMLHYHIANYFYAISIIKYSLDGLYLAYPLND